MSEFLSRINFEKPALVPAIAALATLLILLSLGIWQLDSMGRKNALIAEIAERTVAELALAPGYSDSINKELEYQRVYASGSYRHDTEVQVYALGAGGSPGYHIFTPFERISGGTVLINRGWVPEQLKSPATRSESLTAAEITIEGVLRLPKKQGLFTPDNSPENNIWYWLDLSAIAAGHDISQMAGYIMEAAAEPSDAPLPRGGVTKLDVPNDHLEYALTWFGLAIVLTVLFAAYHTAPRGGASQEIRDQD